MFDGLKSLFGKKDPTPPRRESKPSSSAAGGKAKVKAAPKPKVKKINLERRFTLIGETGQGSMSRVYRAVDNENGRVVCLKVQDRAKTTAALARADQARRPSEGEVGLKINHPRVVRTFEWGHTTKGETYIVMEYIDGVSMTLQRESRVNPLPLKIELLAQAAEALAAVHAAGFIHHDFGPKNLMVTNDQQVKLIDFGLTIPNTPEFRKPGNRTGTLTYLAPEVIRREPKDERIDIFSWGATAFEFLTNGRAPYDSGNDPDPMVVMRLRINSSPRPVESLAPHLPADLCAIVNKALARKAADRWPKAATLADALRELPAAQG